MLCPGLLNRPLQRNPLAIAQHDGIQAGLVRKAPQQLADEPALGDGSLESFQRHNHIALLKPGVLSCSMLAIVSEVVHDQAEVFGIQMRGGSLFVT